MKVSKKPSIAGGRTLSKMYQGKGSDGGGKQHGKKKTWFEKDGVKFERQAKLGATEGR